MACNTEHSSIQNECRELSSTDSSVEQSQWRANFIERCMCQNMQNVYLCRFINLLSLPTRPLLQCETTPKRDIQLT